MSKIFRKIRFSSFGQKGAKGYLIYSLLEVLLVMIGILLALYISNWNDARKERIVEEQLLTGLKVNLEKDIVLLNNYINIAKEGQVYGDSLFKILQDPEKYSSLDFFSSFNPLQDNLYFATNSGYFDEAISTGKIAFILNDSVREGLFDYYRRVKQNNFDEDVRFYNREIFAPEIVFDLITTKEITSIIGYNSAFPALDIEKLATDKDFNSALLQKIFAFETQITNWRRYLNKAEVLVKEIGNEFD